METVNVHEAKTHFSRLLARVQEGQEFVIAKAGRPVARLGPLARQGKKRRLGLLDGKFRVPDGFNEPLPDEVIAAFEGQRRRRVCSVPTLSLWPWAGRRGRPQGGRAPFPPRATAWSL